MAIPTSAMTINCDSLSISPDPHNTITADGPLVGIPMETAVTSLKAAVVGDSEALALIEKRCIVCFVDNLAADKLRCRSLQR